MSCLEMQTLMHHSFNPKDNLYLIVDFTMSWEEFISFMPSNVHCWMQCSQCIKTWRTISSLADDQGNSVLFRDNILVYPDWSREAISAFKRIFRSIKYTGDVLYRPKNLKSNDGVNFGREYSGGHEHIFLESNLNLNLNLNLQEEDELLKTRNNAIAKCLHSLETQSEKWLKTGFHSYFKQASNADYNSFTSILKVFCLNMAERVLYITEFSKRLLRPALILELITMCKTYEAIGLQGPNLIDTMILTIKTFKLRANVCNKRETIFRNFILNVDDDLVKSFVWPDNTYLREKIAAISLKNSLLHFKDITISCKLMGISVSENETTCDTSVVWKEASGLALKAFLKGDEIHLGYNEHRLNILYHILTQEVNHKILKLTADEEFLMYFSSKFLEDIANPIVSGYFTCSDVNEVTMMHNTLVKFTTSFRLLI